MKKKTTLLKRILAAFLTALALQGGGQVFAGGNKGNKSQPNPNINATYYFAPPIQPNTLMYPFIPPIQNNPIPSAQQNAPTPIQSNNSAPPTQNVSTPAQDTSTPTQNASAPAQQKNRVSALETLHTWDVRTIEVLKILKDHTKILEHHTNTLGKLLNDSETRINLLEDIWATQIEKLERFGIDIRGLKNSRTTLGDRVKGLEKEMEDLRNRLEAQRKNPPSRQKALSDPKVESKKHAKEKVSEQRTGAPWERHPPN